VSLVYMRQEAAHLRIKSVGHLEPFDADLLPRPVRSWGLELYSDEGMDRTA